MQILPKNSKRLGNRYKYNSEDNMCSHHTFNFSKGGIEILKYSTIPPSKNFLQF